MNEALITLLNLFLLGGGILYFSRKGTPQAAQDVITIFKARDEEQKELITQLREEVKQNSMALAHLEGVVSEKDKKLQEYLDIFKDKSPDDLQYREDMRKFTVGVAQYMKDSAEIFAGMKVFMTQLNQKAQENQDRQTGNGV